MRGTHDFVRRLGVGVAPLALAIGMIPSAAAAQSGTDLAELREEIAALRAGQDAAAARIAQLEQALARSETDRQTALSTPAAPVASPPADPAQSVIGRQLARQDSTPAAPVNPAGGSSPGTTPVAQPSKLALSGDLRVRYESNFGDEDARGRDRGVVRARLRASYTVNKWLAIGGQIATGDAGDPNSTDITLTGFDNDLAVSLDQAYMRGTFGNLQLVAGKFPQPFVRTELVWDGDVSPAGASAAYKFDLGGGASLKANGLYFLIDESVTGPNSDMVGGQLQFESAPSAAVRFELAAGYYDYQLGSLAGGDTGDFRTNRFADGRYLSDFDLLDIVGAITFTGLGEAWPVRVVGDYVHNFGATTDQDSGFGVDLLIGRATKVHDVRFGYGYAEAGVDAVLTAFSHDNTDLASNYLQHTALVDFVVAPNIILNGTLYHYKPKSPLFTTGFLRDDWINRARLNLLVNF